MLSVHSRQVLTVDCLRPTTNGSKVARVFLLPTIRDKARGGTSIEISELEDSDIPPDDACAGHREYFDLDNGRRFFCDVHLYGIVLELSGVEPGHFTRAGYFEAHHATYPGAEDDQDYHHFLSAFEQTAAATVQAVCTKITPASERPEMMYKLTIS